MEAFTFSALGTEWTISVYGKSFPEEEKEAVLDFIEAFGSRFSRFREESEANAFRNALPGSYEISETFAEMLQRAEELRELTSGRFDPGLGLLLEEAGYDKAYSFSPKETETLRLSEWSLKGREITLEGPIVFDLGGIGKGYCIDRVAEFLRGLGHENFLIDAGGDMYGTEKEDGSSFRIALEWPGKPDKVFGTVELRHQGLAASDTFRRRWGKWHHILDPKEKKPVTETIGASAIGKNAFDADCMTSALFQLPPARFHEAGKLLSSAYVVFQSDERVYVSKDWPGELF